MPAALSLLPSRLIRGRGAVLVAVVVSLLLHGVLLLASSGRRGAGDWTVGALPAPALAVRLMLPAPVPVSALGLEGSVTALPDKGLTELTTPGLPPAGPALEVAAGRMPRAASGGIVSREPAMPLAPPRPRQDQEAQDGYLPRSQLTVPPRPVEDIAVPSAIDGVRIEGGRQVGVFTLFIDDDGTVRRMVIDGPTLAPVFQALAERTFMAARFLPGQVNGHPVKALVRIEVEFGAQTPSPPSPVVSQQILPVP